jgi:hypothetical protein
LDQPGRPAQRVLQVKQGLLDPQEPQVLSDQRDQLDSQAQLDKQGLLDLRELLVLMDQLDQREPQAQLDKQVRPDPQELQV